MEGEPHYLLEGEEMEKIIAKNMFCKKILTLRIIEEKRFNADVEDKMFGHV